MQLQNRDIQVKYSIILDQDEMNAVIHGLKCGLAHLHGLRYYEQVKEAIISLEAFRGPENEPTEQELPRTIMTPVQQNL